MKVLKGRMHIEFGDLIPGDTFVAEGNPYIKVAGSAGAKPDIVLQKIKENPDYLNGACLATGTLYHYPKDRRVEKVDLAVTGMDVLEEE